MIRGLQPANARNGTRDGSEAKLFQERKEAMKPVTAELVRFLVETRVEDLPDEVVKEAKRGLMDAIGCAIAGITTEKGKIAVALARRLGGPAESSIIGPGDKVSCANAALANGELINSLDYDALPHIHPFVVPPALALAESTHASGRDLILALVLGQEISKRLMAAISNMIAKLTEQAKTPDVFGNGNENIFGACGAVGKLLNLGPAEMAHAIGIAGYLCPLPTCRDWEATMPKSMIKYSPVGWICQASITAALLAREGFTGNPAVFDGPYGFPRFYSAERWEPEMVLRKLGEEWLFMDILYKAYPCCSFFHTQLDCFIKIIEKQNLMPDEIESVKSFGLPFVANPSPLDVTTQVDVQFSLPFCLACAAHRIKIGADWQDFDTIRNPNIQAFMKKVTMLVDPRSIEAKIKNRRNWFARVEVAARGEIYAEEAMYAKGSSFTEMRATDEELAEKFRRNAAKSLTQGKIDRAVQSLFDLEKVADVSALTRLIG